MLSAKLSVNVCLFFILPRSKWAVESPGQPVRIFFFFYFPKNEKRRQNMSLSFFLRGRLRWRNQAAAVQSVENSFQVSAAEKKKNDTKEENVKE